MIPARLRTILGTSLCLVAVGLPGSGLAKKHKEKPLRSIPGGASQKWACQQLVENACDLAKRCEPDKSLRHCRKLRDRCEKVKDRPSRSATEDDVSVCAQAVSDLTCKQVSFDNTNGVSFDIKKLQPCSPVAQDNPVPPAQAAAGDEDQAPAKGDMDEKSGDEE